MKPPFRQSGAGGWFLLAGLVIGWDIIAPESMSAAFARAIDSPEGMVTAAITTGIVVGHLFQVIPEKYDPIMLALKAAAVRKAIASGGVKDHACTGG